HVRTYEVDHLDHLDRVLEQLGLLHVARDAVEHEQLSLGMELIDHFHPLDVVLPHVHRELIRHQLAAAGVFPEDPAHLALEVQRAKDVAGGTVVKTRDRGNDLSLRSLARAGRAKEEDALVLHGLSKTLGTVVLAFHAAAPFSVEESATSGTVA